MKIRAILISYLICLHLSILNAVVYVQVPKNISKNDLDDIINNIAKPLSVLRQAYGQNQLEYELPYVPNSYVSKISRRKLAQKPPLRRSQNSNEEKANNKGNTTKRTPLSHAKLKQIMGTIKPTKKVVTKDKTTTKIKKIENTTKKKTLKMKTVTTTITTTTTEATETTDTEDTTEATEVNETTPDEADTFAENIELKKDNNLKSDDDDDEDEDNDGLSETTTMIKAESPNNKADSKNSVDILASKNAIAINTAENVTKNNGNYPISMADLENAIQNLARKYGRTKNTTQTTTVKNEMTPVNIVDLKNAIQNFAKKYGNTKNITVSVTTPSTTTKIPVNMEELKKIISEFATIFVKAVTASNAVRNSVNVEDLKKVFSEFASKLEKAVTTTTTPKNFGHLQELKKVFSEIANIQRSGTITSTTTDAYCNAEKILREATAPALVKDIEAAILGEIDEDVLKGKYYDTAVKRHRLKPNKRFGFKSGPRAGLRVRSSPKSTRGLAATSKSTVQINQTDLDTIPKSYEKLAALLFKNLNRLRKEHHHYDKGNGSVMPLLKSLLKTNSQSEPKTSHKVGFKPGSMIKQRDGPKLSSRATIETTKLKKTDIYEDLSALLFIDHKQKPNLTRIQYS